MRAVGLRATAGYLPNRWMTAAEIADASGIPEEILIERFGVKGKHIAAPDEHVSDMSVAAASRLIDETGIDPAGIDAVVYFGSTWKDYQVWQAAPHIAHRLGASQAFALELDYTSCGSPVAVRVVRDLIRAEPELKSILAVAACRESYLLDYQNERSRFMFNFGDGAVAALFQADDVEHEVLGAEMITDGSFSLDVKVPAGGSVEPASVESISGRRHFLDVADPLSMKERLDPVSLNNFVAAAEGAMKRSGLGLEDIDLLCGIHMKRSMHEEICAALGVDVNNAVYLDDTGHMSGVDSLFGLDRVARSGGIQPGQHALLLGAGTGYTWAAACIRW
ncbi:MAG: 3-oxoacyl-ACP synthase [Actinobacteria bacterium]|nr:MAG: 3-oxoacyl-ACP synthase [Actinomycetota bacterium]